MFDKHCTSCHDYGKEAGEKLNLAGDLGLVFNTSYVELRSKRYVQVVGAGPHAVQMPKTWGSHASRLTKYLIEGHGDPEVDRQIHLDREAIDRVLTWIDINAPYYPDYAGGAYRENPYGRAPITDAELKRLKQLAGSEPAAAKPRRAARQSLVDWCNFTRPELSRCLASLAGQGTAEYQEALGILRAGQQRLAAQPRPDMPGFRLTDPVEIAQEGKYQSRSVEAARGRSAVIRGQSQSLQEQ